MDKQYYRNEIVKILRLCSGLTLDEAAKNIGISYATYRNAESGIHVKRETLLKIAKYYGIDESHLQRKTSEKTDLLKLFKKGLLLEALS